MNGIEIVGIQKNSLIDYPGKIVSTVFLNKCTFRCPFCHNPELVLNTDSNRIKAEELIEFLEKEKKWIDGICLTGGEPTLHEALPEFISRVKEKGFLVKLDTNGTNPVMLKELIEGKKLDYIAMDIKGPLERYEEIVKSKVNEKAIQESIELIRNSGIEYEFRTTVVPEIFLDGDEERIGEWLKGSKKYVLQQFNNEHKLLDHSFQHLQAFSPQKMQEIKEKMNPYFEKVELRGVPTALKKEN
ncbi:MAG: anaerobic ribonucleoside-triphosphate reductase activating protein [archaeon]